MNEGTVPTTILVPLDGSPLAERALAYAVTLTRKIKGHLVLLRVVTTDEATKQIESDLSSAAAKVAADAGLAGVDILTSEGDAGPAIVDAARSFPRCLIVMSTHGRSGIGRWIYGSVADEVIRTTDVPVVLVSTACQRLWSAERPFRILVPLDGSPLAETALTLARDLADDIGANLILLRAVAPLVFAYADAYVYAAYDPDLLIEEAERYLKQMVEALQSEGRTVQSRCEYDFPASAIADIARQEDVDLVVMATHGSGGLTRLVMGSVATGTVQQATVPVMLVRPATVAEEAPELAQPEANRS